MCLLWQKDWPLAVRWQVYNETHGRKSAVEKVTPRRTPKSVFSTPVTVLLLSGFGVGFFNDTEQ